MIGTTRNDLPKVTLTLEQVAEVLQRLPAVPREFAQHLRPYTTAVHNLDYVSESSHHNLQARYDVTGDGDLHITLTMHGGQHVWQVTLPCQ